MSESIARLSIDQSSFATRANLKVSASYSLTRLQDGKKIIKGTVNTVASYNILSSDFATIVAEDNARKLAITQLAELLHTRLGVHFKISAPDQSSSTSSPSDAKSTKYGYPN
ncbi:MAG: hypothetical protein JKY92_09015 [Magnetovibrio sp.]|nr:hypothetical protein [Magnetovibrio sp.]